MSGPEDTAGLGGNFQEEDEEAAETLAETLLQVDQVRSERGLFGALEWVAERLPWSRWLSDAHLCRIAQLKSVELRDLQGARSLLQETTTKYPERAHLRGVPFEIRWRAGTWNRQGVVVFGRCGPTPKEYRECWTGPLPVPLFRLQLSLAYWILATEKERARLVHHELGHCALDGDKPVSVPHHIEEFADTLARFGLLSDSEGQGMAAIAILHHPSISIDVRPFQARQQALFSQTWEKM